MRFARFAALAVATALSAPAMAGDMAHHTTTDAINNLETMAVEGGLTRELTIGLGSGAFRHADDPANVITVVSDRGPNFTCKAAKKVTGIDGDVICQGRKVRIYPTPSYTPSIYKLQINEGGSFSIKDVIAIKDAHGNALNGMLNPLKHASTEKPVDLKGQMLSQDPSAIDAEGVIRLNDGTYWIGEENGPSILHLSADGRVLKRIVPTGTEGDYEGAQYPVIGGLPEVLYKRATNRGIESMAVSPDESKLYFIMQNPLANPDVKTYKAARNTRVVVFDRKLEKVVGEYVYQLTKFEEWPNEKLKAQNTQRISEMLALGDDRLLVLERTNKTTKYYEISLDGATNILGTKWDDLTTAPSLEAQNDLSALNIVPTAKTLRWDSADYADVPVKIEGLALLGDGRLAMINDNDFGITGLETKVLVLTDEAIKGDRF